MSLLLEILCKVFMAYRINFTYPSLIYEVIHKRPSDISWMHLLFLKLYAFPHAHPAAWFAHPPSSCVLDPADLWSLLTSQASYFITLPLLCAILAAISSSLEQFSEGPCQPTRKAFEMANEPLSPVASLGYDGYVMCSSGLAVVKWTRDRHFLCEQNHSSCFSLGPSSVLTTGNCEWKIGMWSTMKHVGMF